MLSNLTKTWVTGSIAALVLSACGGGGGDSAVVVAVTPQPVVQSKLSISGTAATGLAISGKVVSATCATGSGTSTTLVNGTFAIDITGGVAPCVLQVTTSSGVKLHSLVDVASVASSTSATAVANITPVSDLIVARVAGQDPTTFFTTFAAGAPAGLVTTATVADATTTVIAALSSTVDLTGIAPLTSVLTAANGSNLGNAFDQKLDALIAAMGTAGVTQSTLTASVVSQAGSSSTSAAAVIGPVLQASSSSCAAVKSGKYRSVSMALASNNNFTNVLNLNTTTGVGTFLDASTTTVSAVANSPCAFTDTDGGNIYFAKSGAGIRNQTVSATKTPKSDIILPEQDLALADLAGTWNFEAFDGDATQMDFVHGTATVSSAGAASITQVCDGTNNPSACHVPTEGTSAYPLSKRTGGGFDLLNFFQAGNNYAFFAFRASNGDMMMVGRGTAATDKGGFIWTKQAALSMPTVGVRPGNGVWVTEMTLTSSTLTATTGASASEVLSVDVANNTYVEKSLSRPDARQTVRTINSPFAGFEYRAAGTWTMPNAAIGSYAEYTSLPMYGLGLQIGGRRNGTSSFMEFIVFKP